MGWAVACAAPESVRRLLRVLLPLAEPPGGDRSGAPPPGPLHPGQHPDGAPPLRAHELVAPLRVVGDVERVVVGRPLRVGAALDDEGVRLAADHRDLRDEQPVHVPGDAPAHVACHGGEV